MTRQLIWNKRMNLEGIAIQKLIKRSFGLSIYTMYNETD